MPVTQNCKLNNFIISSIPLQSITGKSANLMVLLLLFITSIKMIFPHCLAGCTRCFTSHYHYQLLHNNRPNNYHLFKSTSWQHCDLQLHYCLFISMGKKYNRMPQYHSRLIIYSVIFLFCVVSMSIYYFPLSIQFLSNLPGKGGGGLNSVT